jgi:hypothetical protein
MRTLTLAFFLLLSSFTSGQGEPVDPGIFQSPFKLNDLFDICSMSNRQLRPVATDKGFIYISSTEVGNPQESHYYKLLLLDFIDLMHYPLNQGVILLLRNTTDQRYQEWIQSIEQMGYFMYSREFEGNRVLLRFEKEGSPFSIVTLYSRNRELVRQGTNISPELLDFNSLAIDVRKE